MLRETLWYARHRHGSTVKIAFSVMISVLQIRAPTAYPPSSEFPKPVIPEHFEPHFDLLQTFRITLLIENTIKAIYCRSSFLALQDVFLDP